MTTLEGATENGGYFSFDAKNTVITFFDGSTHSVPTGHLMDVQFMSGSLDERFHQYDSLVPIDYKPEHFLGNSAFSGGLILGAMAGQRAIETSQWANQNVTARHVFMGLIEEPAPDFTNDYGNPVSTYSQTSVMGLLESTAQPVYHLVHAESMTVVNVTLPGHGFHGSDGVTGGLVVRRVIETPDGIFVQSIGVGIGGLKWFNDLVGKTTFDLNVQSAVMRNAYQHASDGHCFPAGTKISMADGSFKPIEEIKVGDLVLSFDPTDQNGLGELVASPVKRLFRNETSEWIKLSSSQLPNGQIHITPGHRVLKSEGGFEAISNLVKDGSVDLVNSHGKIIRCQAEHVKFSEDQAILRETSNLASTAGALAIVPDSNAPLWTTYNFEVENFHTYVAEGFRVHNDSLRDFLGDVSATQNNVWIQSTNDLGGVASYVNEQGDIVKTNEGSRYTKDMLVHYGVEERDANGNVTAKMTLGGHFRALGDLLGFDGEFGIQGKYAKDNEGSDEPARDAAKPVIIDLDGDGVEVNSSAQISFDWDNDGYLESGNWAAADDGFLVIDLEADGSIGTNGGDGVIDQGREIAFSQWAPDEEFTDLQALAEAKDANGNLIFDSNGDGVLNNQDSVWNSMKIFQDLDQDGEVDEGELRTLDSWGISQINLSYDDGSSFSEYDDDVVALGNILHGLASYVRDGEIVEGGVGDVSLMYNTQGWRYVETASGYQIEFESGDDTMAFWDMEGLASADANLTANGLAGAYGDARANVLDATGSQDQVVISGGDGNDQITGGDGDDMLTGGQGADIIHAGAGHDVVLADSQDNISGGAVTGGEGYDKLIVSQETTLNISDVSALGFEAVIAGNQNDYIVSQDDEIGVSIDGNGGNDTLVTAGGHDVLSGGEGDDSLVSGAGSDRLFGGTGADRLDAGDDADYLSGGTGNDTLLGGAGNDRYQFSRGHGHDLIHDHGVGTIMERSEYYENVTYGSGKNASYVNELRTGFVETTAQIDGGIDTLEFGYNIDLADVIFTISGSNAVVQLRNLDDADTAANENASISAEDSVTIQSWDNEMNRIENFAFSNGLVLDVSQVMNGQTGHDEANSFTGTADGDWLNSGGGDDTLNAGDGHDILIAGDGNDVLSGGAGRDVLFSGDGNDNASGGDGDDYILGGLGADTIDGGAGNDALSGDEGADSIVGGAGNDTILGGTENDHLNGGSGDDTYIYFRGDGQDTIHEFASEIQDVQEETGQTVYQRSGKSGQYVQETRTVQRAVQIDGGWDALQFGYTIFLDDVFFELQGSDLVMGIRQLDENGNELTLAAMEDVVTVEDWTNTSSRVEELRFGDGLALDVSDFSGFQSGYETSDSFTGSNANDLITGGGGADTLLGAEGDDVLAGGAGNDSIEGGLGEDDLFGGDGDDVLKSGDGNDFVIAGAGKDTLEGGAGDDVLNGGKGDDVLRGGLGNDIYIFNRGDGHDTIDESIFSVVDGGTTTTENGTDDFSTEIIAVSTGGKNPTTIYQNVWVSESRTGASVAALDGGDDILQFGHYIDISDLMVATTGNGMDAALVVELEPILEDEEVTDSITISNWGTSEFRVETFKFANGFTLDVSAIVNAQTGTESDDTLSGAANASFTTGAWLVGGEGNDTIFGSLGHDIIAGGADSDRLEGGLGNDVYIFGRGDGSDVIFDVGSTAVGTDQSNLGGDKLLFDAGITIEDLSLVRDGNDMKVYVGDQHNMTTPLAELEDVITVENWASAENRVELLQFFNGLDFDISGIEHAYSAEHSEAVGDNQAGEQISGTASADWLSGANLDDVINALAGDDFIFGRDGDDTINAGDGDDIVSAGDGADSVTAGNGADVVTGGAGDDTLLGEAGNDVLMGGSGNDLLNGGDGNDLLVGDLGDDTIIASAGQDQIRFGYGDGSDVYQGNAAFANTDVFVFEDDIDTDNIWFERIDNDLIVRLHGADDTFTFQDWYYGANPQAHVQGFAAGDQWLGYDKVNSLVDAMAGDIASLNDGTTAYGLLLGETPDDVLTAIDNAWT